jgi:hypothetical protein
MAVLRRERDAEVSRVGDHLVVTRPLTASERGEASAWRRDEKALGRQFADGLYDTELMLWQEKKDRWASWDADKKRANPHLKPPPRPARDRTPWSVPILPQLRPPEGDVEVGRVSAREAETEPCEIGEFRGRPWWLWHGEVYSTDADLTGKQVEVLLNAQGRKLDERVARVSAGRARNEADGLVRAPIPDDVKILVWQRDAGRCVSCRSNAALEFDHIIPLSMGGANSFRNLQLLCEACNRAKGGRLV